MEPFLWAWILAAPLAIAVIERMSIGRTQTAHR